MLQETKSVDTQDVKQEQGTQPDTNVLDSIPRSRLNEVIAQKKELEEQLHTMKAGLEEQKVAELEEQGKVVEVNIQLKTRIKGLEDYKIRFEKLDQSIRTSALERLPENKREKFSDLPTESLLAVVEELTLHKDNPPDNPSAVSDKPIDWKKL